MLRLPAEVGRDNPVAKLAETTDGGDDLVSGREEHLRFAGVADPAGVPVRITSPARRVTPQLSSAMMRSKRNATWRVEASCSTSPFRVQRTVRSYGSVTSSAVVIQGPSGMVASMLLPLSHWPPWRRWRSRWDTSLGDAQPEHVLPGPLFRDGPAVLADDQRDFGFIVPSGRDRRVERDVVERADHRARALGEERRMPRPLRWVLSIAFAPGFLEVVPVVPARAQDVAG